MCVGGWGNCNRVLVSVGGWGNCDRVGVCWWVGHHLITACCPDDESG